MPVLFIVLGAAVVLGMLLSVLPPLRAAVTRLWRAVRGDRGIARKLNNAKLAQGMAMGMASGLPVEFWDERGTTITAHGYLNETNTRGKKRKAVVDAVAAVIILEDFLRARRNERNRA